MLTPSPVVNGSHTSAIFGVAQARTLLIGDDYFCRSATTILAGCRARPDGSSGVSVPLGADGHRRAGQVAEAEAHGRKEARDSSCSRWDERAVCKEVAARTAAVGGP